MAITRLDLFNAYIIGILRAFGYNVNSALTVPSVEGHVQYMAAKNNPGLELVWGDTLKGADKHFFFLITTHAVEEEDTWQVKVQRHPEKGWTLIHPDGAQEPYGTFDQAMAWVEDILRHEGSPRIQLAAIG